MFLQNEGLPILGNTPIELFDEQNDGLGNLSVSPCLKKEMEEELFGVIGEVKIENLWAC